jgi:hypothetical protein
MKSHVNWKSVAVSAAMLVTSVAVPYAVITDESSSFSIIASAASSTYTLDLNQSVTYSSLPEDDKMIGWEWADFNIPASENVTKVEINISTTKDKIGKWQGAFGSSTTVSPEYWTQTDDMEQTFSGKTGTITWNVDSATSSVIQYGYGGALKFGIWWIDCDTFTIDSIKVYTNGSSSATTTTVPTTTTTVPATTTAPITTTAKTTTVTTASQTAVTTAPPVTTENTTTSISNDSNNAVDPSVSAKVKGDVNNDGIIDVRDVTMLKKYVVKLIDLNAQEMANADVISDGYVNVLDLGQLLKYIIKVITSL